MAKDTDILLQIDLEPYEKVNNKLTSLINDLKKNNILDIQINFSQLKNQVNDFKKEISNNNFNMNIDKSIDGNMKSFDKLKEKVEAMYSSMGTVSLVTNGAKEIDKFTVELKKADGIIQKFKYSLNESTGNFNLVDTQTVDKTAEIYEKALQKQQQLQANIDKTKEKESMSTQNELYKELTNLQKEEFNIKQKLISANEFENNIYTNRLELIRQQQSEVGKLMTQSGVTNDGKNSSLLLERKRLTEDLSIAQNKYNEKIKEEQKEIENVSKRFKDSMNTKIQGLSTGKYKDFVPKEQLEDFQGRLNNLNKTSLKDVQNEIKDLRTEFGKINADTKSNAIASGKGGFLSDIKSGVKDLAVMAGVTLSIGTVVNQLKNGIKVIYDIDKEMIDLKKVTDETRESYAKFGKEAHQTAMAIGTQSDKVIRATAEWSKAGESFENAKELAKTTLVGSNVGDASVDDIHKFLIAPLKAFDLQAKESMDVLDIMNNVSNKHAITVKDLGEAYSLASSVMAIAGNDIHETTALITAAQAKTQLGGNVVGQALKSVTL